jgi:hypothetical protein
MNSEHNESIYNIVPPTLYVQPKPEMHRSAHSGTIPPTASTFHLASTSHPAISNIEGNATGKIVPDKPTRTFGKVPGSLKNDPNTYMKKYANSSSVPNLAEVKRSNPEQLKPTHLAPRLKAGAFIPSQHEPPVMNLVSQKNFIVANAVETILAQPKKVTQGAKDYLNKEDYGKTPKYLQNIKRDIEAEYDYIRQLHEQNEMEASAGVRGLDEEERQEMISGLKAKWESVNTAYQGGTHITKMDTQGKMARKEKHEAELAQIEKDIEKLNKRGIHIDMGC